MKLMFVTVVDHAFCSHRLNLALTALAAGCEIVVVTDLTGSETTIRQHGMRVIPLSFSRSSLNPFRAILAVARLSAIYRREKPELIHHIAMKPVLFGSIAAKIAGISTVTNLIGGRGWLFTSSALPARVITPLVRAIFRMFLGSNRLVVQNHDDAELMESIGFHHVSIVPGSGVDPVRFFPLPPADGPLVVVLVARMLWDKGIGTFVEAARIARRRGTAARFVLVGPVDPESRSSIAEHELRRWQDEGVVEVWGSTDDVPSVLAQAHIACLPSYSEGIPKSLLEAASCGLPLVTTDVPGCREVVIDGENGFVVPVRNPEKLAEAIERLIATPELRQTMGARSRQLVMEKFTTQHVIDATLEIYREVLASGGLSFPATHDRAASAEIAAEVGAAVEERGG